MLCNLNPSERLVEQLLLLIWSAADGAMWLHVSVLTLCNRLEASSALTDELSWDTSPHGSPFSQRQSSPGHRRLRQAYGAGGKR